MRWHGHWASPWCGLCIDYAAEKGVTLEMEMMDRDEVTRLAGQPRMPTAILTMPDELLVCVSESTRVIDLLDRSYPPPEYFYGWSVDSRVRGQQQLMEHGLGAMHQQVLDTAAAELSPQGMMPALLENALAELVRVLEAVQSLAGGASPFFFGDEPTVVDYQAFHVIPFNRCLAGALLLGKRDCAAFAQFATRMPVLALLGDPDFSRLPDFTPPAESDAYLRWRDTMDDRREGNGLRRGCLWQKALPTLGTD